MKYAIIFALFAVAFCDLYLHHPRGSNDRLNEANTNRNNANRLFDSQNNAKGGYCWGPEMTFYEKSLLAVEWTTQHGCGANPKLVCNLVVQYMCSAADANPYDLVRDGDTTDTITNDANGAVAQSTTGLLYGMHENWANYLNCQNRERNMGLYIADRRNQGGLNEGRRSAIFTRQNNNGNRHGYECPEERDYYPYWHPSPWKDVVILTHNPDWCDFYTSESQNVKAKNYCLDPANPNVQAQPNNEQECTSSGYTWMEQRPWGIPAPECIQAPWSRENHLGNGQQNPGFANNYNWTVPDHENCTETDAGCACALRIRYNVSTTEYGFDSMSNPASGFIDWTYNDDMAVITEDTILYKDVAGMEVALAQDTTQYGRTFEDRSHTFRIAKRPSGVPALARIFNLNVRGKRGNIVQAYPATEYDFIPQHLYARVGDYIHFQWTGCDTNPAGNAGEGRDGTDRSNCVQIPDPWTSVPITDDWIAQHPRKLLFESADLRNRMTYLDQTNCLPRSQIGNDQDNDVRNCGKLNGADRYFNGGVIRMNRTGSFNFMSTRNHNFTNRDQKGTISIKPLLPNWALGIVVAGAALFAGAAGVAVMMFYAKNNPHSQVANIFSKM